MMKRTTGLFAGILFGVAILSLMLSGCAQMTSTSQAVLTKTPYATLTYPAKLSEFLKVATQETEDTYSVTYSYVKGNQAIELFAVRFSVENDGNALGTLMAEDKTVYVSAEMFNINEQQMTDSTEMDTVYAMQEAINEVVQSVQENTGYTAL